MCKQNIVLLKLTGEFLKNAHASAVIDSLYVRELARQIRALQPTHYFGIVVGGGNFFRGTKEGVTLGMTPNTSDTVGMLATLMNATILQDLFAQEGVEAELFSALECPDVASAISPQMLRKALRTKDCIIFGGGLGNPFFTTDTTSIVRALQIQATEVWKITKVDGIYSEDPRFNPKAERIAELSYTEAMEKKLEIMDETAFSLAREHRIIVRVFSLYTPQALIRAAHETSFGSKILP
jgi:uridylate kinase